MRVLLLMTACVLVLAVAHSQARTLLPATDHSTNLKAEAGKKSDDGKENNGKKILTPDQVFQGHITGQVTVEFRVAAVSLNEPPFVMEEATSRPPVSIGEGKSSVSRLQVTVSEKAKAHLHRLGIEDLCTHFYGKFVRVSGKMKREVIERDGSQLVTYSLTIASLDQLKSVSNPPAGPPGAGRAGGF